MKSRAPATRTLVAVSVNPGSSFASGYQLDATGVFPYPIAPPGTVGNSAPDRIEIRNVTA